MEPRLSIVIAAWNEAEALSRTLPALVPQLGEDDELIVADNGSTDRTPEVVRRLAPGATIVPTGGNLGFPVACNAGADAATGDLLLILNPDAMPLPGFCEAIKKPWTENRGWAAWMGLVTQERGRTINTAGNPIHFTGVVWAGGNGRPVPPDMAPHEVPTVSGACFCVPLETWRRLGGFPEPYFLYHEDADLSVRLRLEGGRLGIEPSARLDHEYEFGRRAQKLQWMERNRWAFIVRTYPAPLLVLLGPALLATEVALHVAALAGGWGRQKLIADWEGLRRLPWAIRKRRRIQARAVISAAELSDWMTAELDHPFFGRIGQSRAIRRVLRNYLRLVQRLLGRRG